VTGIKELPEEICNLSKLEFFNLSWCRSLSSLPYMIGKLTQLQFLILWNCDDLVVPLQISQLVSLKKLGLDIHTKIDVMDLKGLSNLIDLCLNIYLEFESHEIMETWLQMTHLWLDYVISNLPSGMQNLKEL
jgi:hypothetical protein